MATKVAPFRPGYVRSGGSGDDLSYLVRKMSRKSRFGSRLTFSTTPETCLNSIIYLEEVILTSKCA